MQVLSSFVLILSGIGVAQTTHEIRYAALLREQSLYRLSELQCRKVLEDSQLSDQDFVQITIELSKTLTVLALNSRPPEQDELWRQSVAVLDRAFARPLDEQWTATLRMQQALTVLHQAEWARRVAEVRAHREQDWEAARQSIRHAIKLLRQVEQQWKAPRMRAGAAGIANTRVEELLRNTQYQLARAYRNQAITYPRGTKDRINSLTLALQYIEPIASSLPTDDVVWRSRLDRVQCIRLLGDLSQARALLNALEQVPDDYVGALAAEGIRLALDAKQPEVANRLVASVGASLQPPEFELARIETYVALAIQEPDEVRRREYHATASRIAALLGRDHGTYWGLRGEMLIALLADHPDASASSQDNDLLETAAETFLQRGLPDEATKLFVRAARQAEENGDREGAFAYRKKAAIIEHQEGNLQPAVDRFQNAALAFPDLDEASEAHLMAIFDAAALYQKYARSDQSESANKFLGQYTALLKQHLKHWPDHDSSDQVRIWFGRLAMATRDWEQAVTLLQEVKPGSAHSVTAYRQLGRIYSMTLHATTGAFADQLGRARSFFAERLESTTESDEWIALTIESARLLLFFTPPDYAAAKTSLQRVLATPPETAELPILQVCQVIALAGSGEVSRASAALNAALPLTSQPLLELLRGLLVVRDRRPNEEDLAELIRDGLRLLNTYRNQLAPSDLLLVQQSQADTAPLEQAKTIYAKLAIEYPRDVRIQLRYAELLSQGRDRQARHDALEQWRRLLKTSHPQSYHWFRAKLGVAQSHFDQGQHGKAREILKLMLSLYPNLSDSGLQSDYEALLARCEA